MTPAECSVPSHRVAWEADALPTELLPLGFTLKYSVCVNARPILAATGPPYPRLYGVCLTAAA
jgi:hypothetical protein